MIDLDNIPKATTGAQKDEEDQRVDSENDTKLVSGLDS
jgi:hypothetical protein